MAQAVHFLASMRVAALIVAAEVVFSAQVGMSTPLAASGQADEYLLEKNLSYGWNSNRRVLVTSGTFVFSEEAKGDKFEVERDAAFFEAFRRAMIEQCKLLHANVSVTDSQSLQSPRMGALELSDFSEVDWKTEFEDFIYRQQAITEMGKGLVSIDEIGKLNIVNISESSMTVEGQVTGLLRVEFFESYDDSGIGETCVLIISKPENGEDTSAERFMRGESFPDTAGYESFEDWIAEQDVESMTGVQRYIDNEGKLWIVGCAPIINGDRDMAFKKARFWTSFVFGAEVLSRTKTITGFQGENQRSIYADKEMLSTKNGVLGSVFPEDFVQRREISGQRIRTGKPCKIMLCILPPGASKYQAERAKQRVEHDIKRQYILGKLDSLKVARKVFKERISTLTPKTDKDGRKRRELEKALKEITATIDDLEALLTD